MNVKEVQLKLKFGTIAAKWWGSMNKRPIIAIHGWQDNAGSFDALIPLLPLNFSYLAIDLPGHGLSSHFPDGCFYHINDFASILEEIRTLFGWDHISLMAHSMGVLVSFIYSSLFPHVDVVIAIDTLKPVNLSAKNAAHNASTRMKKLYVQEKISSPAYSFEEITERIFEGSLKSLNRDKVELLVKRGVKRSQCDPNKFQLTRDIRIKYINPLFIDQSIILIYIKQIQAAYLFIKTDDKTYDEPTAVFNQSLEQFRKYNRRFEMIHVHGTHHVHMNNPEVIAPKICEFLNKYHMKEMKHSQELKLKL